MRGDGGGLVEGAPAAGGGLYAPRTLQRRRPSRYHPHPRFPPPTHFPDSALQYTQASVQECSKAGYRNEAQARQDHVSPCVPPTPPPYTPPPSHSSQPSDLPCLLSCPLSPYSLLTASAPLSHAPAPPSIHTRHHPLSPTALSQAFNRSVQCRLASDAGEGPGRELEQVPHPAPQPSRPESVALVTSPVCTALISPVLFLLFPRYFVHAPDLHSAPRTVAVFPLTPPL